MTEVLYHTNVKCQVECMEDEKGWSMPGMHYHDGHEIYILDQGERMYIIDGVLFELKRGDAVLIAPHEFHSTGGGGFRRYLISFQESYLDIYFTKRAKEELLACFLEKKLRLTPQAMQELLDRIRPRINQPLSAAEFASVMEILNRCAKEPVMPPLSEKNKLASEIIEYIGKNYTAIATLEEIAGKFYITKYYLCRLFKEYTGMSVFAYINTQRIQSACDTLARTKEPVSKIAAQAGFHSSMYFCRMFKAVTGTTPLAYRRQHMAHYEKSSSAKPPL